MRTIFYWPDGYWCDRTDLPYTGHRSDDFGMFDVSFEVDDDTIDAAVQFKITGDTSR